jgi:hypothetical protein
MLPNQTIRSFRSVLPKSHSRVTPASLYTELAIEQATASLSAEDALLTLPVEGSVAAGAGNTERPEGSSAGRIKWPRGLEGFRLVPGCCPLRAVVAGACRAGAAAGQLPWWVPPCQIVWLCKRMGWLADDQHSSLSMRLVFV